MHLLKSAVISGVSEHARLDTERREVSKEALSFPYFSYPSVKWGCKLIFHSLPSWFNFCTLSKACPIGHLDYKDISDGPCRTMQDGHQRSVIFLLLLCLACSNSHACLYSISSNISSFWYFLSTWSGDDSEHMKCRANGCNKCSHPWNCSHFFFQYSGLSRPNYLCFGFPFNHYSNGCNSVCLMFSLESTLHQWLFSQSCVLLNVLSARSLSALL